MGITTIQDIMIEPIQRFPRYVMLLTEAQKHTPLEHTDTNLLPLAIAKTKNMTERFNTVKRESDNGRNILAIKEKVKGCKDISDPSRKLLLEGIFDISGKKNSYTFYLFNDILMEAKNSSNKSDRLTFKHIYVLKDCTFHNTPDGTNKIQFSDGKLTRILIAPTHEAKLKWLIALKSLSLL